MKIFFWAVGKAHETYVKEGVTLFTKRISHYFPVEWKLLPPSKNTEPEQIKKDEAAQILHLLKHDDLLVVLDEKGKQWDSIELADFIQKKADSACRQIIFLTGGAYGIHEPVLKRCNYVWSLSRLVFPHQLVRLILAEQIYRACTIIRNEKYHHL